MEKQSIFKRPWFQSLLGITLIVVVLGVAIVYKIISSRVSIDRSMVSAPIITIGPEAQGVLQQVYVKAGDSVTSGEALAQVGGEVLTSQINGLVITINNTPGQVVMPGATVVSMIDPTLLRIVGTVDEDKGFSDIKVGDPVSFTVDAFSGQSYTGTVSEISPTSNDSGVAFDISDQRPTKQFDVKVSYDISAHPEFKNGMSAKMDVYPKH